MVKRLREIVVGVPGLLFWQKAELHSVSHRPGAVGVGVREE
jgi:hypothetical protein